MSRLANGYQRGSDQASKITRLETSLEGLSADVQGLANSLRDYSRRTESQIDALTKEFQISRSPNWSMMISAAFLIIALGGAALTPLYIMTEYNRSELKDVKDWQVSYTRGQIPSAAEPRLSAMDARFTEVETQFKNAREQQDRNTGAIGDIKSLQADNRINIARLQEQNSCRGGVK